ncbi:hypothetical protein DJ82_13180 [Halorubrum sp. Ib24]|uniref:hypothetical protein n=1 Tax=unclassified Halorubrum TaxID=2642239 RepID=UPI000B97E3F6|nr:MULTISPECIES: hypothetical protein [unclassified Halorubrum]OYR38207.1 hypothetical protein DJ82_13180 [Halorubrum sp. Ib24]OYR49428.1 hypothetical protein DJ75_01320 [Halorubrum sp. Eb13]OYR55980.1 hypothetical protein DJ73_00865 [Halorubrum sp. Ea1]
MRRRNRIRAGTGADAAGVAGGLAGRRRRDGPPLKEGFEHDMGDREADATHGVTDPSVRVEAR